MNIFIIKSSSPYNLLIGRIVMKKMGIVVSTIHAAIKFHTLSRIGIVFSTYEPNIVEEGQKNVKETIPKVMKDVLNYVDAEEMIIVNDKYPGQAIDIGKQLPTSFKGKLQDLLNAENHYAYKEVDELKKAGILREVKYQTWVANPVMVKKSDGDWRMCVEVTVINKACPKFFLRTPHHQIRIKANTLKVKAITDVKAPRMLKEIQSVNGKLIAYKEVDELKKAGILREVKYQTWVANPVMVKKSDGDWRMCVEVTVINKACPKYCYPLSEIDWKVEPLSGFRLKCFLDTYRGYN
nr:reverse transcriptase domain-containing protein [Tanacetum cinerariifolium]